MLDRKIFFWLTPSFAIVASRILPRHFDMTGSSLNKKRCLEGESQFATMLHSMLRQNLNKKSEIREITFLKIQKILFFKFLKMFCLILSFYSDSASACFLAYRISANSFRGNYSFLNLALCTVTFDLYCNI